MGTESEQDAPSSSPDEPPVELFHYRNLQTLFSIIKDGDVGPEVCFWASDIGFQNDASERLSLLKDEWNKKALMDALSKFFEDNEHQDIIAHISDCVQRHTIPCFPNVELPSQTPSAEDWAKIWAGACLKDFIHRIEQDKSKVYTVSFSENEDDLNQWTRYGGNGVGVAIGFNRLELHKRIYSRSATFAKCDYLTHLATKEDYKDYNEHYKKGPDCHQGTNTVTCPICQQRQKCPNCSQCQCCRDQANPNDRENRKIVAQSLMLFFFESVAKYLKVWQPVEEANLKQQIGDYYPKSKDSERQALAQYLKSTDCKGFVTQLDTAIESIKETLQEKRKKFQVYGRLDPCILSGLLKNAYFSSEQEWRLLKEYNSHFSGCQFRAADHGLVPYIPLSLGPVRGLVTSLWLGPAADPERNCQALERWCRQHEFDTKIIKTSAIPYRPR